MHSLHECMHERGLKQHFGAPVESTDEFNNAAVVVVRTPAITGADSGCPGVDHQSTTRLVVTGSTGTQNVPATSPTDDSVLQAAG